MVIFLINEWKRPVNWGCRIRCRGVRLAIDECPGYDTKQSDGKAPVMLELLLPSLPGPLWPRVVAPDRVISMGQIKLLDI